MLRPYIFAVCEKVILDKNDVPSLIGLFNKFTIAANAEVPANAVAPKEWSIFTSWTVEPSDVNKNYVQIVRVLYPNGEPFGEIGRLPLVLLPDKNHSQTIANSQGLPIGQNGPYTVESWIEEDGEKVSEKLSLKFEIELQRIEAKQEVKA